ncbi:hypothetical protein [Methylococcus sp. EFPC2]|uniref:hypothetical protein n=1 Tax=Methylococcus sp. EFPC2 TaxID=2812648 RepID=UPI00196733AF|nr:hypothetical protein [Methylococcus sp. EFPC2]QSA96615.1 hypothetical protein JWZ97_15545 [Methylococcus sp. EFPC2]
MNAWFLRIGAVLLLLAALTRCGATEEGFAAVHQVVSDPLILHLAGPYYLAKERNGDLLLIELDANNEVVAVSTLW